MTDREATNSTHISRAWFWLGISIALQTIAAGLGKAAALDLVGEPLTAIPFHPFYIASLLALVLQTVTWLRVLKYLPLHRAYPFMSAVVPLNVVVAIVAFGETVSALHVLAVALIVAGIALVGGTTSNAPTGSSRP